MAVAVRVVPPPLKPQSKSAVAREPLWPGCFSFILTRRFIQGGSVRRILPPAWPIILLLLFFIVQPATAKQRRGKRSGAPTHPAVAASQQCSDCHSEESADWQASKHGQALVKCLICHGAVESNFIPKPAAERCVACHGENVRHLNDRAPSKGKSCFDCHSPHLLNPHPHTGGVL